MAVRLFENLTMEEHKRLLRNEKKLKGLSVDEKTEIGFEIWTAFYRANIHRFIEDYFGFKGLKTFQKILLHKMATSTEFVYTGGRGQGKSYIISWFVVAYCTLYPNTRVVIASGKYIADYVGNFIANERAKSVEGLILIPR